MSKRTSTAHTLLCHGEAASSAAATVAPRPHSAVPATPSAALHAMRPQAAHENAQPPLLGVVEASIQRRSRICELSQSVRSRGLPLCHAPDHGRNVIAPLCPALTPFAH